MMKELLTLMGVLWLAGAAQGAVEMYEFDRSHTSIEFRIKHLQISRVSGNFGSFSGKLAFDADNPAENRVEVTVDVTSIDTNDANRDKHLNQEDFFNTAKFPQASYVSTQWKKTGDSTYEVMGNLTMMGKTMPLTLQMELIGSAKNRQGKTVLGWEGTAKLDRTQWGMATSPFLGDVVDVRIGAETVAK